VKIIVCGFGRPIERVLPYLVNGLGSENVALYTHADEDQFGRHAINVATELDVWRSTNTINESKPPFEPDIIASIYYRHIIKPHVIKAVNGRIFNAHTSLLPRHRGRSSIPWAIIEGDQYTGITYHYIDQPIDTGNIILQAATQISSDDTQATLFDRLNFLVIAYFGAALELVNRKFEGLQQHGQGSYHKRGRPYGGEIDPAWSWDKIERFIRAMTYPPLPCATLDGKEIKTVADYKEVLRERSERHHKQPVS
jgi:methionyl-tRNA formyltransferase